MASWLCINYYIFLSMSIFRALFMNAADYTAQFGDLPNLLIIIPIFDNSMLYK